MADVTLLDIAAGLGIGALVGACRWLYLRTLTEEEALDELHGKGSRHE